MDAVAAKASRSARELLGWTQAELAERAGLSLETVYLLEYGRADEMPQAMDAVMAALREHGIVFTEGEDGWTPSIGKGPWRSR